jgi:cell division protein FtsB
MMYRNRKRESLRGGVVAKALLACLYFAAVGMGYVWHKNQIYRLGDDIKRREAELAAVEKRTTVLAAHLAQLKSPGQLEAKNQAYNLGLVTPRDAQVVRFFEPGPDWDAAMAQRRGAAPVAPREVLAKR